LKGKVYHHGTAAEFMQIFGCNLGADGDVFLQAPMERRAAVLRAMAENQQNFISEADSLSAPIPLSLVLTAREVGRLQSHMENYEENYTPNAAYITDLDQNLSYTTVGPTIPTLVTHGKLYSVSAGQFFIGEEHLLIQGENVFDGQGPKDFPCHFKSALPALSQSQLKHLAGNAMHLPSVGLWLIYNLSCMVIAEMSSCKLMDVVTCEECLPVDEEETLDPKQELQPRQPTKQLATKQASTNNQQINQQPTRSFSYRAAARRSPTQRLQRRLRRNPSKEATSQQTSKSTNLLTHQANKQSTNQPLQLTHQPTNKPSNQPIQPNQSQVQFPADTLVDNDSQVYSQDFDAQCQAFVACGVMTLPMT
jgi:hypothetical protein